MYSNSKTSEHGDTIWLSILGEVYDVTAGREFYQKGSQYGVFAGRDASIVFSTGSFTEEEGRKGLDALPVNKLRGVEHWRQFYEEEQRYKFVGKLIDPRFYDKDGYPTPAMIEYYQRMGTYDAMKHSRPAH